MARKEKEEKFDPGVDKITHPSFTVFTEYDFTNGKISSCFPLWYFDSMKENIINEITRMNNAILFGFVPEERIPEYRAAMNKLKKKLQEIEDSERKFGSDVIDYAAKVISTLSEKISNAMPTRTEMEKGFFDPAEEARRMTTPCIILNETELRWAKICNCNVVNNKVSRTEAEKMWKIARKLLGEDTNTEILRKG